jgi:glutaconate CoA-transferase subunit A
MPRSFLEARARLTAKDRSVRDKRMSLAEAATLVRDGDRVAVGGCLYSRTPMAMLLELLRRRRRDLTVERSLMCYEAELFFVRGVARHIVSSWVGIGLPWGIPKVFRRYVEEGRAVYEEWSHLAFGLRFKAAAMGVPFLPTFSMLGSDLLALTDARTIEDPFTGQPICLVPAVFPDVALIHVHRADPFGNAQIDGPPYMDREMAQAAQTVIVTTEEVVEPGTIARSADRTAIPHFLVDAVVEVPFGSYPHECYGLYEADFDHFSQYVDLVETKGTQGVEEYVIRYVDEAGSFEGFLDRAGVPVLLRQARRARELLER